MEKRYLEQVIEILNKRAERALQRADHSAYTAYTSAISIIEYAAQEDNAVLAQFDY